MLYLRGGGGNRRIHHDRARGYVQGLRDSGLRNLTTALVPGALHYLAEEAPERTWNLIASYLAPLSRR